MIQDFFLETRDSWRHLSFVTDITPVSGDGLLQTMSVRRNGSKSSTHNKTRPPLPTSRSRETARQPARTSPTGCRWVPGPPVVLQQASAVCGDSHPAQDPAPGAEACVPSICPVRLSVAAFHSPYVPLGGPRSPRKARGHPMEEPPPGTVRVNEAGNAQPATDKVEPQLMGAGRTRRPD